MQTWREHRGLFIGLMTRKGTSLARKRCSFFETSWKNESSRMPWLYAAWGRCDWVTWRMRVKRTVESSIHAKKWGHESSGTVRADCREDAIWLRDKLKPWGLRWAYKLVSYSETNGTIPCLSLAVLRRASDCRCDSGLETTTQLKAEWDWVWSTWGVTRKWNKTNTNITSTQKLEGSVKMKDRNRILLNIWNTRFVLFDSLA